MGYKIEDTQCLRENVTCLFSLVNGGVLTTIGLTGTLLSSFTIYCLLNHVKLPFRQNLFILNVAASDVLIAILGTIRGLGIISPTFIGYNTETGTQNWWCSAYTFFGNTVWMSAIPVLLPLTLDRFVAVIFPLHYKTLMTKRNCRVMVALTWSSLIAIVIHDIIALTEGTQEIKYQKTYHRCVFDADLAWKKSIYVLFPFLVIMIMYGTMVFYVRRARIETRKLLVVSTLIIVTGLITNIPEQLLVTFKVNMTYEVTLILVVTFWYTNSIWNPIIYFASKTQTKETLKTTPILKRIARTSDNVAERFSVITDDLRNLRSSISIFTNETAARTTAEQTESQL